MSVKVGPNLPTVAADDASTGTLAWTAPNNALLSDNVYANANSSTTQNTHYLKLTGYGFTIPAHARIDGVEIRIERSQTVAGSNWQDNIAGLGVVLVLGGVIQPQANGKNSPAVYAATDEVLTYGGPTDAWGAALTPAIINGATFGVAYSARHVTSAASTAQIDVITITVYYTLPGDMDTVTMKLRRPEPPHETVLEFRAAQVSYARLLMQEQRATFRLPRSDPNLLLFAQEFHPERPPMYTIERSDKAHPWVGFLRRYSARKSDSLVTFELADHMARFRKARTKISGTVSGSTGAIITNTVRDMETRGEPPLYVQLGQVQQGPATDYAYRAQYGHDFLRQMVDASGWEWGFGYSITADEVVTSLLWQDSIGLDRRDTVVFEESRHVTDIEYVIDYEAGIDASVVIGGSGNLAGRRVVGASKTGRAPDVDMRAAQVSRRHRLGGTRVLVEQQVTDELALRRGAQRFHDAPGFATEQIAFTVVEYDEKGVQIVDMRLFDIGDIVTVRMLDTDLGLPREPIVRITGISYDPERKQHPVTAEVIA